MIGDRSEIAASGRARYRRVAFGLLAVCLLAVAALAASSWLPQFGEAIKDSGRSLGAWIWPFAAAMAFLETSIPPLTLVFPGEWALLYIGAFAGQGELPLLPLLALVWASSTAGDAVAFFLGRRLGRPFLLRHGARLGLTHERLARVDAWFERYGPAAVTLGRLVPFVRPTSPFLAGSTGFPFRRFLPWDLLGTALFSLVFCLLGYVFYHSRAEVEAALGGGGLALLVLAGLALVVFAARRRRGRLPASGGGFCAPPPRPGPTGGSGPVRRRLPASSLETPISA